MAVYNPNIYKRQVGGLRFEVSLGNTEVSCGQISCSFQMKVNVLFFFGFVSGLVDICQSSGK